MSDRPAIRVEAWGKDDLPLLEKLLGDPRMMVHLGGPESHEKLIERQASYETLVASGTGRVLKIVDEATGQGVGGIVYWERSWDGEEVYEIGWSVIPEFQGRGIAGSAIPQAIASARAERKHRFLHAFPSVDNGASNALCRKLGFTLMGQGDFEYPKGSFMKSNIWRLDLHGSG